MTTTTRDDLAHRIAALDDGDLCDFLSDLHDLPDIPSRGIKIAACGEEIARRPFARMLTSGEQPTSAVDVSWAYSRWLVFGKDAA